MSGALPAPKGHSFYLCLELPKRTSNCWGRHQPTSLMSSTMLALPLHPCESTGQVESSGVSPPGVHATQLSWQEWHQEYTTIWLQRTHLLNGTDHDKGFKFSALPTP